MAIDLVTPIVTNWTTYVFGSAQLSVIVFMAFFLMIGLKRNWPLDLYIVVFPPLILLLSVSQLALLPPTLWVITLIGLGIIVGVGLLRLTRQ